MNNQDDALELLCDVPETHGDVIDSVRRDMPEEDVLYELADLFKMFGDSTRLKIMSALSESEMCVCDIAELLGISQSAISHQLRILKQSKLVSSRREGKNIVCFLADEHVRSIIAIGLSHVTE